MAQAINNEGRAARRRMNGVVHGELDVGEHRAPRLRRISTRTAEDVLQNAVDAFSLAIRLRMIGRRHGKSRAETSEQLAPEASHEYRIAVRDNRLRKPVGFEHVL